MFPPKETSTTTTTTYADENELLNEELDGVTSDQKYENNNYNNNGYTSTYNNNGYERSNYINKNNNNGYKLGSARYETGKVSTQNQGSYGNDENPNEFNTMEEYKSQEGYEESQEESLP
ncbi:hypothetical protein D5086_014318 [Populus alba]|uniref:Uncharacterized protein n=1 Tax=Populus alba TaxID=43335 RepID=A0ACC4BXU0_POPAL